MTDQKFTDQERVEMAAAFEAYRAFLEIDQAGFAQKVGVSRSTYGAFVRSKYATDATYEKMLSSLGKTVGELLTWYRSNLAFVQSGTSAAAGSK